MCWLYTYQSYCILQIFKRYNFTWSQYNIIKMYITTGNKNYFVQIFLQSTVYLLRKFGKLTFNLQLSYNMNKYSLMDKNICFILQLSYYLSEFSLIYSSLKLDLELFLLRLSVLAQNNVMNVYVVPFDFECSLEHINCTQSQ